MAKGSNNISGRRSSSRNTKPYDANNSFVKKVATKVTDLIPQKSWISKWFNTSQDDGDTLDDTENPEEVEAEEDIQKPPPLKRPCIRMDVTHPPGTFLIQPRVKSSVNKSNTPNQHYSMHNETVKDFSEPAAAGPSGMGRLISSTPATETDGRTIATQRSELNSLVAASNNGTANDIDDNSESSESTSGCSSLIPQTNRQEGPSNVSYSSPFSRRKRFIDDKLSFTNHLQSPRSLFLDSSSRDSLSSRRPSFNASVMSNTLDRASPLSSPFYNGNITFGGANAAGLYKRGHGLFNNTHEIPLKVPKRTSVEVKPSATAGIDSSGMSQTAKKILEALEHFSSPITDAKKIPLKITDNTTLTNKKKRARDETSSASRVGLRHMTRELTVPTVPDILKLRRRQKLQDTTAAARKIVSARREPPAVQEYSIRTQADEDGKHHGNFKAKKANLDEEETVQAVNLPNITLPMSSLPSFNFMSAHNPNAADKSITSKEETFTFASPIKVTNSGKNLKSINNFTFSSPISANDKQSVNNSSDLRSLKKTDAESNSQNINCTPTLTQNFIWSGSSTAPRPKEKGKNEKPYIPACELRFGSVMDVLGSKSNKTVDNVSVETKMEVVSGKNSSEDKINKVTPDSTKSNNIRKSDTAQSTFAVWECSECLIKNNNSETHCLACKASKPNHQNKKVSESSSTSSNANESKVVINDCFGSQFKLSSNQWECTSCCVRNKQTDVKCVACNASKPNTKHETESNKAQPVSSDLLNKFKPAEGSWECPGCMLRNAANVSTCPCCNASKPNSLRVSPKKTKNTTVDANTTSTEKAGTSVEVVPLEKETSNFASTDAMDKFKASKDTWECPTCMVRNATSVDSCPCCNTGKPNAGNAAKNVQPLSFNGFGDKFKKPEGAWTCDSCLIQNEGKVTECIACNALKPGSKKPAATLPFSSGVPANPSGFKFGIDKSEQQKPDTVTSMNGFKFGDNQQSSPVSQFTFGIQKDQKSSETLKSESNISFPPKTSEGGFGFQINSNTCNKAATTEEPEKSDKKSTPFSFGVPKSESATVLNENQTACTKSATPSTPCFTFGVPKSDAKEANANKDKQASSFVSTAAEIPKPTTQTTGSLAVTSSSTNIPPITQVSSQEPKPAAGFSFSVPNSTVAVSINASTSVGTACLPSAAKPSFAFPETKPVVPTAAVPTFGQAPTSTSTTELHGTFTFGENKVSAVTALSKNATALPSTTPGTSIFSNMCANIFAEDNKPTPVFGANASKPSAFAITENKVPSFTSAESKPSIFGTSDAKIPVFGNAEKPTPVFNPTPSASIATPTPSFGTPSTTPSLFGSSVTSVFENNATSTFANATASNIFSTSKPSETTTPSSNLFTFGTSSAQPVAQPGNGFNFTAGSNPTASTQKQLFTFGSSSTTPQSSNLFGGSFSNPPASNSSSFTFNAPEPETPSFGQPAVSTPIFGAAQTNSQNPSTSSFAAPAASNVGFSFGSAAPATSSEGFNFGGMAPTTAPSTGGFNFNPPSATPTFDPNTRPSFNFTGGSAPPTFNATPQSSVQRKIKKAVRRMK